MPLHFGTRAVDAELPPITGRAIGFARAFEKARSSAASHNTAVRHASLLSEATRHFAFQVYHAYLFNTTQTHNTHIIRVNTFLNFTMTHCR